MVGLWNFSANPVDIFSDSWKSSPIPVIEITDDLSPIYTQLPGYKGERLRNDTTESSINP